MSDDCDSCCEPTLDSRSLAISMGIIGVVLPPIIGLLWFIFGYNRFDKRQRDSLSQKFRYKGRIPTEGTHKYQYSIINEYEQDWITSYTCKITFSAESIKISDISHQMLCPFEAPIENNSKIQFSGPNAQITLYLTQIQGTDKPGLLGYFKVHSFFHLAATDVYDSDGTYKGPAKNHGSVVLMPFEAPSDTYDDLDKVFPPTNSHYSRIYFVVILVLSLLCFVTYSYAKQALVTDYIPYALAVEPWGGFMSLVGLIFFFIFANPFGFSLVRLKAKWQFFSFAFLFFGFAAVALLFSDLNFLIVEFLHVDPLYNAKNFPKFADHNAAIQNTCKLNEYDCSVIFSENYGKRDNSCKDAFKVFCVSFDLKEQSNCSDAADNLFAVFLGQGLMQFSLCWLWVCAMLLTFDLYYCARWSRIAMKLDSWNSKARNVEIEMN